MNIKWMIFAVAVVFAFSSCEKQVAEPDRLDARSENISENESVMLKKGHVNGANGSMMVRNFRTHLTGENEVPSVETDATGQAIFKLRNNGKELHYKLIVANIENVLMAHIHVGGPDENGGVLAWLYPASPPPQLISGKTNGVLHEGVITSDDLTGSLDGKDLSDLLELMKEGQTYVNVHTEQHPAGEIRGQIMGN